MTQSENPPRALSPSEIRQHSKSRVLELVYEDGRRYELTYEFLRVFTPSAEARGHGDGQGILQTGKSDIDITHIEMVGNYAIRPVFSDGHETGIYSWEILHFYCTNAEKLWQAYLDELTARGASRAPSLLPGNRSCGGRCGKKH